MYQKMTRQARTGNSGAASFRWDRSGKTQATLEQALLQAACTGDATRVAALLAHGADGGPLLLNEAE